VYRDGNDDNRVISELYRLMPPRQRKPSQLADALDAAGGGVREALDAAAETPHESSPPELATMWSGQDATRWRRSAAWLGQALCRVDVWILIVAIVGVVVAIIKP